MNDYVHTLQLRDAWDYNPDFQAYIKVPEYKNDPTRFSLRRNHNELTNAIFDETYYGQSDKESIQEYIESLPENSIFEDGLWYYSEDSGILYKINTSTKYYKENREDGGDGFVLSERYDIDQLTKEEKEILLNRYQNDRDRRTLSGWLQAAERLQRSDVNSDGLLQNRKAATDNAGLDEEALQRKPNGRSSEGDGISNQGEGEVISSKTGFNGDNGPRYIITPLSVYQRHQASDLRTPAGELYGFAYNGEIWLDESKLSLNAPLHEYTHLWDAAVQRANPRLWNRGKKLMKQLASAPLAYVKYS